MSWEYMTLEPTDYGHPGAGARYGGFVEELNRLAGDGWELVQLAPSMMRGRITPAGQDETVTLTAVALCAILRRKVE